MFWLAVDPKRAVTTPPARLYLSRDPARIPAAQLHALLQDSYWARGIPLATVERALTGSLCMAVLQGDRHGDLHGEGDQLLAFARAVTDGATFAWLCDVIVHPAWRGHGLGKQVVAELLAQPELQGLRRVLLATADAHGLYQRHDFAPLKAPERWLEKHNPDVYQSGALAPTSGATNTESLTATTQESLPA